MREGISNQQDINYYVELCGSWKVSIFAPLTWQVSRMLMGEEKKVVMIAIIKLNDKFDICCGVIYMMIYIKTWDIIYEHDKRIRL